MNGKISIESCNLFGVYRERKNDSKNFELDCSENRFFMQLFNLFSQLHLLF
jgi:hypothetical protein